MILSTLAQLEGMYYKPRIDHELLEKYNKGLIVLSGCAGSEVSRSLRDDNYQAAKDIALWYKSVFGDRYYLEMQNHEWDEQTKVNLGLQKISKEIGVPLVVSNDGHYLLHEDKDAEEILLCVGTGSFFIRRRPNELQRIRSTCH